METHQVFNQPPPLQGYNLFEQDPAMPDAVVREGAPWAVDGLRALGERAGTEEAIGWGFDANANPPVLHTHDRFGNRIDRVVYHPSYHRLMEVAVGYGLHGGRWPGASSGATSEGGHVARAAAFYLWSQVEAGHSCPISMTYSVLPALRSTPGVAAWWHPRLTSTVYDPADRPVAEKAGALAGMAMTEKQGGSDVRANTTTAVRAATEDDGTGAPAYRLTGHKWFCSAPMGDLFLVLAQAEGGLTCFALPRWAPDGMHNRVFLQRLKDKLGNRSNASSEIDLDGAWAQRLGDEGRGVATIIEMVSHTRLDCVIGAAAGMRQAVAQATHHCAHRAAFGRRLADQPLMANVLADLAVESEASTLTMLRLAGAFERAGNDDQEAAFRRVATAVAKYWTCKRQVALAAEALECLGGNGYVEESILPRLFRESPLNGIWEGSGNVMCLDVLRAMARQPETVEAFVAEVARATGGDHRLDLALDRLCQRLGDASGGQGEARRLVEQMALALQGSLLVRYGHRAVADAFSASRLAGEWGWAFGTLPPGLDLGTIVERATPKIG